MFILSLTNTHQTTLTIKNLKILTTNLKIMKLIKYRIIKDEYAGYEVQIWRLWIPFWMQKGFVNTYPSIEKAKKAIELYKNIVVYTE